MSDTLDLDFEIVTDEAPDTTTSQAGRPGKYEPLVTAAREAFDRQKDKTKPGPFVVSSKKDAKTGKRTPNVSTQAYYGLRKKFGEGNERHVKTGEYFELMLDNRTSTGKNGSGAKGVLWVRKMPAEVGENKAS